MACGSWPQGVGHNTHGEPKKIVVMALIRPFDLSDMKVMVSLYLAWRPFRAAFNMSVNHV